MNIPEYYRNENVNRSFCPTCGQSGHYYIIYNINQDSKKVTFYATYILVISIEYLI